MRNPVMFVVFVGSLLTTALGVQALAGHGEAPAGFILAVSLWLWFTVLFGNFAEAMAEGRGKAQAQTLRKSRREVDAKKLAEPRFGAAVQLAPSGALRRAMSSWSRPATSSPPTAK
jgi:potassium-transporting ATPase ATP-binding subunit